MITHISAKYLSNILVIIIAGLMNGSFVIPTKYIKNISNEKIR